MLVSSKVVTARFTREMTECHPTSLPILRYYSCREQDRLANIVIMHGVLGGYDLDDLNLDESPQFFKYFLLTFDDKGPSSLIKMFHLVVITVILSVYRSQCHIYMYITNVHHNWKFSIFRC